MKPPTELSPRRSTLAYLSSIAILIAGGVYYYPSAKDNAGTREQQQQTGETVFSNESAKQASMLVDSEMPQKNTESTWMEAHAPSGADYSTEAFAALSPRDRALRFLALIRENIDAAGDLLASSESWLKHEKEGLSAILFEEVVREEEPAKIGDWLFKLSTNDSDGGLAEYLLSGALETPGLIADPEGLLGALARDKRKEVADVAQAESLLLTFENEGFAEAIAKGGAFGIQSNPEDPKFEALIGSALQKDPQKVLTWLNEEVPGSDLAKFYLPFALSQWSWQDFEGASSWQNSLSENTPRDLGSEG